MANRCESKRIQKICKYYIIINIILVKLNGNCNGKRRDGEKEHVRRTARRWENRFPFATLGIDNGEEEKKSREKKVHGPHDIMNCLFPIGESV